jgi:chorismate mutase-like protein
MFSLISEPEDTTPMLFGVPITMSSTNNPTIDSLRVHIDRIDEQIHDLLMARASLVERIGSLKSDNNLALRPGREAQILRRLSERHMGIFPKSAIFRIWREILGSLTNIQCPMTIAVAQAAGGAGFIEMARDHFGTTPMVKQNTSAGQVIKMVAEDTAAIGVVPLPGIGPGGNDPWWAALTGESAPKIILRLPFYPYDRIDPVEGLAVAKRMHDDTGNDRTFLIIETAAASSIDRTRALVAKTGLTPTGHPSSTRMGDVVLHFVEVEGWVEQSDPRLEAMVRDQITHVTVVGGYPVPLSA